MQAPRLNYEQLRQAYEYCNEDSYTDFLINVMNSYEDKVITKDERTELLALKGKF